MTEPESLDDYFSILMMIYPQNESPRSVIMDNACNFYSYCMRREPFKFKNMICWTDEFHGGSHKCGPLYHCRLVKELLTSFRGRNDSHIEQINKIIKVITVSCGYMNLEHFVKTVMITLEIYNREKVQTMDKINKNKMIRKRK